MSRWRWMVLSAALAGSAQATTYYLGPTGDDAKDGLTPSSAWLTPQHDLLCGDEIIAAASSAYVAPNFGSGKWGRVSCAQGEGVAWLKCERFAECRIINSVPSHAMLVTASHWGIQGWEAINTAGECFSAAPQFEDAGVHHVVFANNVANGCQAQGIGATPFGGAAGPAGVDYFAIVGNLIYGADSAVNVFEPIAHDVVAGTHIYVAQNIIWSSRTDAIMANTWNGSVSGFAPYPGQGVVENNLILGSAGAGIRAFANDLAPIIIRNNTSWGGHTNPSYPGTWLGELLFGTASKLQVSRNIAAPGAATCCAGGDPLYAIYVGSIPADNDIDFNWAAGDAGNNLHSDLSPLFSYGSNQVLGQDPAFANPALPGAPNCAGSANALECAAATLNDFRPTAPGAAAYGYQSVNPTYAPNPEFPAWLCAARLPPGIVSNHCPNAGGAALLAVGCDCQSGPGIASGVALAVSAVLFGRRRRVR